MIKYPDALAKIISNSGKTLREISDLCKKLNVMVDPSYISRLQSGKQMPASDEINVTIAKVCGTNPDELLIAAHAEKAPMFVQSFIGKTAEYLREIAKNIIELKYPKSIAENKRNALYKLGDWELVHDIINDPEYGISSLSSLVNTMQDGTIFTFEMPDESLSEIPSGTKVIVSRVQSIGDVREGDYLLVALGDNTHHIRRLISHESKKILLADNLSYKSYTLDEGVTVVGKVIYIQPHFFKP